MFLTLFHGNGKDLKEWNENRNQNGNSVHEKYDSGSNWSRKQIEQGTLPPQRRADDVSSY